MSQKMREEREGEGENVQRRVGFTSAGADNKSFHVPMLYTKRRLVEVC